MSTVPETRRLITAGAAITYDVRRGDSADLTPLLLIGSPMGAQGFTTLAGHLPDRTVVTYDPRGVERSEITDGRAESTPHDHAGDLAAVIDDLGGGVVDIFASSGGAVNALELVAQRPDAVRVLVAHEPPLLALLPDSRVLLEVSKDINETYQREGFGPAMAKFIGLVSFQGELGPDYLDAPPPDPAAYGLPSVDDGSRNDPLLGRNMIAGTHHELDLDKLRDARTRILVALGHDSGTQAPGRAALALATALGIEPTWFPGDHGGFLGGEYGQTGVPTAFAARLREVLPR